MRLCLAAVSKCSLDCAARDAGSVAANTSDAQSSGNGIAVEFEEGVSLAALSKQILEVKLSEANMQHKLR